MSSSSYSTSSSSSYSMSSSISSSSSSSASDLVSSFFRDIQMNDTDPITGEQQLEPLNGDQQVDLNAFIASLLNPEMVSDSSSSSSSSSSSDQKDVKISDVQRALVEVLKIDDDKDGKEGKLLPFINNVLGVLEAKHDTAMGYRSKRTVNVARALLKFLHRPIYHQWHPALTAPAPRGNFVLVGTDEHKAAENHLLCLNCPDLVTADERDYLSILSACRISEPARHPTWISDTRVLACTLTGSLSMFSFNPESKHIAKTDVFPGIHTGEIRELALCPSQHDFVASTGADRNLCVTDLSTGTLLAQTRLTGTGGSVKWSDLGISLTLDSGSIMYFDIRASLVKPRISFHLGHTHSLYTHSPYADRYALLGYASGDIRNVDVRTCGIVSSVQDYYVEGIGMIECRGNAFVTSGYSNFSVWKQDAQSRETNIWSHSDAGVEPLVNTADLTYVATWLDADTVLASDSQGYLGVWSQGFGADPQVAGVINQLATTRL